MLKMLFVLEMVMILMVIGYVLNLRVELGQEDLVVVFYTILLADMERVVFKCVMVGEEAIIVL